jgi:hypothetical protein
LFTNFVTLPNYFKEQRIWRKNFWYPEGNLFPELPPAFLFGLILECGTLVKRVRIINIDS